MAKELPYKVRWIVAPLNPERSGLYGTTTHPGRCPSAAALASAESVWTALPDDQRQAEIHILSVFAEDSGENLLTSEAFRLALSYHDKVLPIEVRYRPLC